MSRASVSAQPGPRFSRAPHPPIRLEMTSPAILCAAIMGLDAGERQQSPDGLYLKFSGAVVMQQDAELLSVGGGSNVHASTGALPPKIS